MSRSRETRGMAEGALSAAAASAASDGLSAATTGLGDASRAPSGGSAAGDAARSGEGGRREGGTSGAGAGGASDASGNAPTAAAAAGSACTDHGHVGVAGASAALVLLWLWTDALLQVFIVHGDLTRLACDAWMLPTDDHLKIESYWKIAERVTLPTQPSDWGNHAARIMRIETYDFERLSPPWLVNVGGIKLPKCRLCNQATAVVYCQHDDANLCSRCDERIHGANAVVAAHTRTFCRDIEWYIDGARQFLSAAAKHLGATKPRFGRCKHLVGLPLVGTGKGGAGQSTGGVVARLLPELYRAARVHGLDIALVVNDRSKFAAVQVMRNRHEEAWALLGDAGLVTEARRLAGHARRGDLVLFLGAGISAGAGLPTWGELITDLAAQAGMTEEERQMLGDMNYLDAARIVELHLGGSMRLAEAVAARVSVRQCSLVSCLLAGLPVKEAVTTNYNEMFEIASRGAGLSVAVLPYSPASDCDRWLLKMHGCASHPEDIVLTREDYLRYATRRSALQGIVQSLLITRHMLFVGFSLQDDNFHRIVDEVRRALSSSEPLAIRSERSSSSGDQGVGDKSVANGRAKRAAPFGTSLALFRNHIVDMLWKEDLNMVAMKNERRADTAAAARQMEIFLDFLSSESTTTAAYLLKPQYDALLTEDQRTLRNHIIEFANALPANARDAPEWAVVHRMVAALGGEEVLLGRRALGSSEWSAHEDDAGGSHDGSWLASSLLDGLPSASVASKSVQSVQTTAKPT